MKYILIFLSRIVREMLVKKVMEGFHELFH